MMELTTLGETNSLKPCSPEERRALLPFQIRHVGQIAWTSDNADNVSKKARFIFHAPEGPRL